MVRDKERLGLQPVTDGQHASKTQQRESHTVSAESCSGTSWGERVRHGQFIGSRFLMKFNSEKQNGENELVGTDYIADNLD